MKLRILVTILAALYIPFVAYWGGWNFERGPVGGVVAVFLPSLAALVYFAPFWDDK